MWPFRRREQRRDSSAFYYPGSLTFPQLGAISARQADTIAAVASCLSLICNAISALPASLTVDMADGTRVAAPRTATGWALLDKPNDFQTLPNWLHWTAWQMLAHGNAVSVLGVDGRGAITELRPVSWASLLPQLLVASNGKRTLAFDVVAATVETAGLPKRLLADDVLHVRAGHTEGGILGQSVLRASGPASEAAELETLVSSLWRNSMRPSGLLSAPSYLTDAQRDRFDESWMQRFIGSMNAGRVPIIEGGFKYETVTPTPQEAELLGTRHSNIADIARLFGIPDTLVLAGQRVVTDPTPYLQLFCSQCLVPIVCSIEHAFTAACLPPGQRLVLDTTGLSRGSFSQIASAMSATTQSGITVPNDARRMMGLEPIEGGDKLRTSSPPSFPADGAGVPSAAPKPGPRGNGVANVDTHQGEGRAMLQ